MLGEKGTPFSELTDNFSLFSLPKKEYYSRLYGLRIVNFVIKRKNCRVKTKIAFVLFIYTYLIVYYIIMYTPGAILEFMYIMYSILYII